MSALPERVLLDTRVTADPLHPRWAERYEVLANVLSHVLASFRPIIVLANGTNNRS